MKKARASLLIAAVGLWLGALAVGCSGKPLTAPTTTTSTPKVQAQGEGVSAGSVPPELREEYALFSQRCSKCHSLARALNNGDHDETYWARYVARMRRQPASGIAPEDEPPILKWLNYYSAQLRAESAAASPPPVVPPVASDAGVTP